MIAELCFSEVKFALTYVSFGTLICRFVAVDFAETVVIVVFLDVNDVVNIEWIGC